MSNTDVSLTAAQAEIFNTFGKPCRNDNGFLRVKF